MTLPTSGPISLSDIQTEFGGSNPISLSEYYAGGGLVPSGTSGTNGPVPTSGAISLSSFYGTSAAPIITLVNRNVNYFSGGVLQATTAYQISFDGNVRTGVGNLSVTYTVREQWDSQPATVADYEVYVTYTGDTPSGTFSTWLNLGSTRTWQLTAPAGNFYTATLSVEIRKVGTTTVLASATINLTSDAT